MPSPPPIRSARATDLDAIKRVAIDAGLFEADEVEFFNEIFLSSTKGELEDHRWIVQDGAAPGTLSAAAYYAPEPFADRMWNIYFIAVSPSEQGNGVGARFLTHIQDALTSLGESQARTLIVETSSTSKYAKTRAFYAKQGFVQEARIRQFYGPNDDKVTFWKYLA